MKASELYNQSVAQVDALQKSIHNHVRDQLGLCQDLQQHQDRMKRLQAIIQTDGDRELTGQEVVSFLGKDSPVNQCKVCGETFDDTDQLFEHYDENHNRAASNPHETVRTYISHLQNSNNVVR